ncbi:MAG: hypothetical protein HIU85_20370, partial [Proteobacteria bacterium]|nr:hypothetical protein [Pseudomonadota bacterium]
MTTKTPLILAAEAARDARAARVDIDAKLAELREQSADIAALQEALAAAREKRTAALADALVHSRKADTGKVDKEIA